MVRPLFLFQPRYPADLEVVDQEPTDEFEGIVSGFEQGDFNWRWEGPGREVVCAVGDDYAAFDLDGQVLDLVHVSALRNRDHPGLMDWVLVATGMEDLPRLQGLAERSAQVIGLELQGADRLLEFANRWHAHEEQGYQRPRGSLARWLFGEPEPLPPANEHHYSR